MDLERSAVAMHVRRFLGVLMMALLAGFFYYALFVGGSPGPIMWVPSLILLLNGLYALVFAREMVAIAGDRYRRHRWERALSLGVEPSEQNVRWSAIAQMAGGLILFALWQALERPF